MSQQGPLDWLSIVVGISQVTAAGVPVANSPGTPTINVIGATSVTYNPTTDAIDVTVTPSIIAGFSFVSLVGPASITATPGTYYLVDVTAGNVNINTPPSGSTSGTSFGSKVVRGAVGPSNKLTITAAASTTVEEPADQSAPATGVYSTVAVYQNPGDLGASAIWFYDGASKWGMQ